MLNWPDLNFEPINLWNHPMPDITKCSPSDCKIKENCYRYTAKPNENWQSYSDFAKVDKDCEFFISNDVGAENDC
jgi:hypothetical protein